MTSNEPAKIAVLGAGWWSQGWHIPQLHRNPNADLVAIVDPSSHPKSNLNPNLEPLSTLADKYNTRIFSSLDLLLQDESVGPTLQGVIVCTPHSTHSQLGRQILEVNKRRISAGQAPIHILMEKPFTTRLDHAQELHEAVSQDIFKHVYFSINHSGNYRKQAREARELVKAGAIGRLRFVNVFFASPLCSIFEDSANKGWNEPSEGMLGNGFAWGQSSHVLAWIFHVYPSLRPETVYCNMTHSPQTGADVAHAASIRCRDESVTDTSDNVVVFSLSGTSLLPGDAHSDPPVGKHVQLNLYGSEGSLLYSGMDLDTSSGSLELRRMSDGNTELPVGEGFLFENLDTSGTGPESLQALIQACREGASTTAYVGASSAIGLRTVQVLDAMYRSHKERKEVTVVT